MMGTLNDSGHRKKYATGAHRERAKGKGRYDLIPPEALEALAIIFEAGAEKYGDRNWEMGLPLETFIDSGFRHLVKLMAGQDDEDHAALALTNLAMFIATRKRGCVPDEVETVSMTFNVAGTDPHVQETVSGWISENRCFKPHDHVPHTYGVSDNLWCDGFISPLCGNYGAGQAKPRPIRDNPQA